MDIEGLRPTPDRVRKTVFDWLTHAFGGSLDGVAILDLFTGTGALGLEAASRGATPAVLVDRDRRVTDRLTTIAARLQGGDALEVVTADAATCATRMARDGRRFDVVFLDPPFGQGLLPAILPLAAAMTHPEGFIYVEAEAELDFSLRERIGAEVYRSDKAGHVHYHLLRCKKQGGEET